jgi:hypothetical protein
VIGHHFCGDANHVFILWRIFEIIKYSEEFFILADGFLMIFLMESESYSPKQLSVFVFFLSRERLLIE